MAEKLLLKKRLFEIKRDVKEMKEHSFNYTKQEVLNKFDSSIIELIEICINRKKF